MRLPYAKPADFSFLSLEERAKFIKQCCEDRQVLWRKSHVSFFGQQNSIYMGVVGDILAYMDAYLKNDLDDCLYKGIKQYSDHQSAYAETVIPDIESCKAYPLNVVDIEIAYDIINQCFLSNIEFFWFALRRLFRDKLILDALPPTMAFDTYLKGTLAVACQKWGDLFPEVKTYHDIYSENIRPIIKTTLLASCSLAFAVGGINVTSMVVSLIAGGLYAISGELSDNIALAMSKNVIEDTIQYGFQTGP